MTEYSRQHPVRDPVRDPVRHPVRQWLEEMGESEDDLARRLAISAQELGDILDGKTQLPLKLARHLHAELAESFSIEELLQAKTPINCNPGPHDHATDEPPAEIATILDWNAKSPANSDNETEQKILFQILLLLFNELANIKTSIDLQDRSWQAVQSAFSTLEALSQIPTETSPEANHSQLAQALLPAIQDILKATSALADPAHQRDLAHRLAHTASKYYQQYQ